MMSNSSRSKKSGELGGGLFTRDDRREPRGFDTSSLQVPRGDEKNEY